MSVRFAYGIAALMASAPLSADDLHDANSLLCAVVEATVCEAEGECKSGPAWNWNVPQFLEIDLKKSVIATTAASGENRTTPIRNQERKDGSIIFQGIERGRAFSFVISEESGIASVAIATDEKTINVFAACTPLVRR
jgi:hypothetical protein